MLRFQITDLSGNVLTTLFNNKGGEVIIPRSDSRTAKVALSVFDPKCVHIKPLKRMLKVWFNGHIVFWGVMLKPIWTSAAGQNVVEINAHDQSIWWKKNFHRYGDYAVDTGYPISGAGIRVLHESAVPLPRQTARGIPGPGIDWGADTFVGWHYDGTLALVVGNGPRPTSLKAPAVGDGLWSIATRGQQIFETIQQACGSILGGDWELEPSDVKAGYFAKLNTYSRQGTDKSGTVVFHRGFGRNNLSSFMWEPDGDAVRNYQVEVTPGGESGRRDTTHRGYTHNEASWLEYGIYEGWDSSNSKGDSKDVLLAKAQAIVDAYSQPPDFFTITPMRESADASITAEESYRYIDDFGVGDTIRAACKTGFMICDLYGRINKVILTSDQKGAVQTALECVPEVGGAQLNTDEGG